MNNREFKGVWIPADLYLNQDLNWTTKLIILEIDSFSRNGLPCFISNAHLCSHLQCSQSTVEKALKAAEDAGFITRTREMIGEHTRRILRMNTVINNGLNPSKTTATTRKKVRHNNTRKNTINKPMKTSKPNTQECYLYFAELGVENPRDEAEAFKDWYDQTGWTLKGGNKIKDWKATARNWVRRQKKQSDATATKGFKQTNFNAENIKSFVTEG